MQCVSYRPSAAVQDAKNYQSFIKKKEEGKKREREVNDKNSSVIYL